MRSSYLSVPQHPCDLRDWLFVTEFLGGRTMPPERYFLVTVVGNGGAVAHGVALHFESSASFLKCELV